MAEFEDKLNAILGNQEAMSQIMALAHSLSGDGGGERQDGPADTYAAGTDPGPELSALLGQVDPKLLQIGVEAVRKAQAADDRSAALISALRPFLREERQYRLDRALQIARMTRLIRAVFGALGEKGGREVV